MADTSFVQALKLDIIAATGLSKDALHVYFGLIVWLLSAALWRKSIATLRPWVMVLVAAVFIEAFDAFDDWRSAALSPFASKWGMSPFIPRP